MCFAIPIANEGWAMKKILIVEDNEFIVEVMSYILVNRGYEVTSLTNGDEVFNNIKTNKPDLVILDDELPGMAGRDICRLLKMNPSTGKMPVIMCSGSDTIDESLSQAGAPNDVLHKPFDIDSLVSKVKLQLAA
jgi:DNA-binding response OmpR family regulator